MLFDDIDIRALRRDIVSAARECHDLKKALRRTWTAEMADEQRRLARTSRHVTELCILRARMRGRWHVTTVPRELRGSSDAWDRVGHHAKIAERVARDYRTTDGGAGEAA
ncbi:Hypothetical protein A7982_07472 [Minicystis rosea]|nr:Hypothetical protein A7982_07472 [Minicystis rosea]